VFTDRKEKVRACHGVTRRPSDKLSGQCNSSQTPGVSRTVIVVSLLKEKYGISIDEMKAKHAYEDSQFIELQGMQVHYRDVGSGPVLILLHGMFSSLHTWEGWIDRLKDDFRVIAVDAPNYGLTGPHPQGMFKHIYSEFLNDFTDALGITECMLAGNSLGGWMSWEFAARYPDKVKKIILIDAAGFFFIVPWLLITLAMPGATWVSSLIKFPKPAFRSVLKDVYGDPSRLTKDKVNRYYDLMMREGNRSSGANVVHFIRNRGGFPTGYLKRITQPTLVMWGSKDRWIPKRHVPLFKKNIQQCDAIIYDGLGHMPMEEMPDKTAEDARQFLLK